MSDEFDEKMGKARSMLSRKLGLPPLPPYWQLRETTPPLDDTARKVCKSLGHAPPFLLEVTPVPGARPGWCFHNVREHVERHGGEAVILDIIWGAPGLFWETECHSVWQRPDGRLVDITPTSDGEGEVLVALNDAKYPPSFEFTRRPANTRVKSYRTPGIDESVKDKIASLSKTALAYKTGRAEKKGMSLDAWIASRLPKDAMERALDSFLDLAARHDAFLVVTDDGSVLGNHADAVAFSRTTAALIDAKVKIWLMAEGAMMIGMVDDKMPTPRRFREGAETPQRLGLGSLGR